eukprot:4747216-Alexandrium_andersonii.AAC.1
MFPGLPLPLLRGLEQGEEGGWRRAAQSRHVEESETDYSCRHAHGAQGLQDLCIVPVVRGGSRAVRVPLYDTESSH